MTINYKFQKTNDWPNGVDFDDVYLRKEYFTQGGLWSWGGNAFYPSVGDNTSTDRSSPVQTAAGGSNWKQYTGSLNATAHAIKTNGTLWSWGFNTYGNVGNGTAAAQYSPVPIGTETTWAQVSAGTQSSGAIKTDGTLWTWGYNPNGQLGDNTIVTKSSPIQVGTDTNWKQVSGSTSAIKTNGTLWTWGGNSNGILGDNTVVDKSSPIQVGTETNWKQVSYGSAHIAAIKTDGTLWTWGSNAYGSLGINSSGGVSLTVNARSSPVQTISAGTNWKQVSCGKDHSTAIKTDGTLWVWGFNNKGTLGDNTITDRSSPVQTVSAGTNWKQASAGYWSTGAIKTDGTLWTCGYNKNGQLGDNTVVSKSSPIQVGADTDWKQFVCAGQFMGGIRVI